MCFSDIVNPIYCRVRSRVKFFYIMLVNVTLDKIQQLCAVLMKEWPRSMNAISNMKRYHLWKGKEEKYPISLLYSKGNEDSGVLIVVYDECLCGPIIDLYALDGYEDLLKDELMNWDFMRDVEQLLFDHILLKHVPVIEEVMYLRNFNKISSMGLKCFSMSIETALKLSTECREDIVFGELSADHLDDIYESWHRRSIFNWKDLESMYELDKKHAIGVFCSRTGELLTRCLLSHAGWITALRTADSAEEEVCLKLLVMKLSKMLAEDSLVPFTFTTVFNSVTPNILQDIGFENIFDCVALRYESANFREKCFI